MKFFIYEYNLYLVHCFGLSATKSCDVEKERKEKVSSEDLLRDLERGSTRRSWMMNLCVTLHTHLFGV